MEYYADEHVVDMVAAQGKPYIVSISGLTLEDNMEMLGKVLKTRGISAVEINLACPNIPGKSITAYDFAQLEKTLQAVTSHPDFKRIPVGVKLPPYFDIAHFAQAADVIAKFPVRFVVCCNSIPNGLFIDTESECEAMAANHGLGGLGGGFVKHTALANVRLFYKAFQERGRDNIDIVGAGGVCSGKDAFELILCGAKAVQVGTCHWTEGTSCFARIASELETIMKQKKYQRVEDFRGQLKPYVKGKDGKKTPETIHASSGTSSAGGGVSADRAGSTGMVYLLSMVILALLISMGYTNVRDFIMLKYGGRTL